MRINFETVSVERYDEILEEYSAEELLNSELPPIHKASLLLLRPEGVAHENIFNLIPDPAAFLSNPTVDDRAKIALVKLKLDDPAISDDLKKAVLEYCLQMNDAETFAAHVRDFFSSPAEFNNYFRDFGLLARKIEARIQIDRALEKDDEQTLLLVIPLYQDIFPADQILIEALSLDKKNCVTKLREKVTIPALIQTIKTHKKQGRTLQFLGITAERLLKYFELNDILKMHERGALEDFELFGVLEVIEQNPELHARYQGNPDFNKALAYRHTVAKQHFHSVFGARRQEREEVGAPSRDVTLHCIADWARAINDGQITIAGDPLETDHPIVADFLNLVDNGTQEQAWQALQAIWKEFLIPAEMTEPEKERAIESLRGKLHQNSLLFSLSQAASLSLQSSIPPGAPDSKLKVDFTLSGKELRIYETATITISGQETITISGGSTLPFEEPYKWVPEEVAVVDERHALDKYFASSHDYTDREIIAARDNYLLERRRTSTKPIDLAGVTFDAYPYLLERFGLDDLVKNPTLHPFHKVTLLLQYSDKDRQVLLPEINTLLPPERYSEYLSRINVPDDVKIALVTLKLEGGADKSEAIKGLIIRDIAAHPLFISKIQETFLLKEFFESACSDSLKLDLIEYLKNNNIPTESMIDFLRIDFNNKNNRSRLLELFSLKSIYMTQNPFITSMVPPLFQSLITKFPNGPDKLTLFQQLEENPEFLGIFSSPDPLQYLFSKIREGKLEPRKLFTLLTTHETVFMRLESGDDDLLKKSIIIRRKEELASGLSETEKAQAYYFLVRYKACELVHLDPNALIEPNRDPLLYIMTGGQDRQSLIFKRGKELVAVQKNYYQKQGMNSHEAEWNAYNDLARSIECLLISTPWKTGFGGESITINDPRQLYDGTNAPEKIRVPKHVAEMLSVLAEGRRSRNIIAAVTKVHEIGQRAATTSSFFRKRETHEFYKHFMDEVREEGTASETPSRPGPGTPA